MNNLITILIFLIFIMNSSFSQWKKAEIPFGGTVKSLITDDVGNIFAGTGNGIYFSSDNGNNWYPRGLEKYGITCFTVSENYLFAGTNYNGIFYSTDKGQNWTFSEKLGNNRKIYSIQFKGDFLYVAAQGGIFLSKDYGKSWINLNTKWFLDYTALLVNDNNIFAISGDFAVFLSTDEGETWNITSYLSHKFVYCIIEYNENIYIGTYEHGVYRSSDNGISWSQINVGLTNKTINTLCKYNGNLYSGTDNGGVYKWNEELLMWDSLGNTFLYNKINTLLIKDNTLFAGVNNLGIFSSENNGMNWYEKNNGLHNLPVYNIALDGNNVLICADNRVLYLSSDNGISWQNNKIEYTGSDIITLILRNNNIYAGSYKGFYFSTNLGKNWEQNNSGMNERTILKLSTASNKFYANTYSYLNKFQFFSLNEHNGTWKNIRGKFNNEDITAFDCFEKDFVVLTDSGKLYISLDTGNSWSLTNYKYDKEYNSDVCIRGINILVTTDRRQVHYSSDYGNSWKSLPMPVISGSRFISNLTANQNSLFVMSSDSNFYYLDINQNIMVNYYEGLPKYLYVYSLAVGDEFVFAGTNSGLYYLPISSLMTQVSEIVKESMFYIYPNPSSDFITIQLSNKGLQPGVN